MVSRKHTHTHTHTHTITLTTQHSHWVPGIDINIWNSLTYSKTRSQHTHTQETHKNTHRLYLQACIMVYHKHINTHINYHTHNTTLRMTWNYPYIHTNAVQTHTYTRNTKKHPSTLSYRHTNSFPQHIHTHTHTHTQCHPHNTALTLDLQPVSYTHLTLPTKP